MKKNKGDKKTRRDKNPPSGRTTRVNPQFTNIGKANFKWRITPGYIDFDHEKYGWENVPIKKFFDILIKFLHGYEDMEWQSLENRNSCHCWKIADIPSDAQKRIDEKYSDKVNDILYQIDVGELTRIIGFRDRAIFHIMWYDANHEFSPIK
jgi:hypothetical protein